MQLNPIEVFPVYEFRPRVELFSGDVLRYNNGDWIKDDGGAYDICFIGMANGVDSFIKSPFKFPAALYFDQPYRPNIAYQWCEDWSAMEPKHPRGNAWHYALKEGKKTLGETWPRDVHPNEVASRAGMNKICNMHGCANGIGIRLSGEDSHIIAGLVRRRDNKKVLTIPLDVVCMYCGEQPSTKGEPDER